MRLNITATEDVFGENRDIVILETERYYQDVDMFEMKESDFAYKFAEICREEIEKIKQERFLKDNPEFYSKVDIDEVTGAMPI